MPCELNQRRGSRRTSTQYLGRHHVALAGKQVVQRGRSPSIRNRTTFPVPSKGLRMVLLSFPRRPRLSLQMLQDPGYLIIAVVLLLLSAFCFSLVESQPQENHGVAARRSLFGLGPLCLFSRDRCGFLNLFQGMHRVNQATGICEDVCVFLPFFYPNYQCGYCPIDNEIFNIDIDLSGVPEEDHKFFEQAKAFWETVIVDDKPEERSDLSWLNWLYAISQVFPSCKIPKRVDDLFICASYLKVDGSFVSPNIIGGAAPLINANGFPVVGIMLFDGSDIPNFKAEGTSEFGEVILHEMGHVLGLGSYFTTFGSLADNSTGTCIYQGERANAEYRALSGCDATLPLDVNSCGHLSEYCFPSELMGPYANTDARDSISSLSLAILEDVGYKVKYAAADNYSRNDINVNCTCDGDTGRSSMLEAEPDDAFKKHGSIRPETYEYAREYGLNFLAQHNRRARSFSSFSLRGGMDMIFPMVSVLVKDKDGIHGVLVKKPQD